MRSHIGFCTTDFWNWLEIYFVDTICKDSYYEPSWQKHALSVHEADRGFPCLAAAGPAQLVRSLQKYSLFLPDCCAQLQFDSLVGAIDKSPFVGSVSGTVYKQVEFVETAWFHLRWSLAPQASVSVSGSASCREGATLTYKWLNLNCRCVRVKWSQQLRECELFMVQKYALVFKQALREYLQRIVWGTAVFNGQVYSSWPNSMPLIKSLNVFLSIATSEALMISVVVSNAS